MLRGAISSLWECRRAPSLRHLEEDGASTLALKGEGLTDPGPFTIQHILELYEGPLILFLDRKVGSFKYGSRFLNNFRNTEF